MPRAEARTTYTPVEAQGRTEEQAEQAVRGRAAQSRRDQWKHFTPAFVGTQLPSVDVAKQFNVLKRARKTYEEKRYTQPEGTVKLGTEYPIGIVFLGDLHLGSVFSNEEEIRRKIGVIEDRPNLYSVLMANLIENAIPAKFPHGMVNQTIPPDEQVKVMRKIIEEMAGKDKILAAIPSVCHEGFTYAVAGQDVNELLYDFPARKFPIIENGGRLKLQLQGVTYVGALYHQMGPFESNFNPSHATRQMNRLRQRLQCDFVAGAHKHVANVEETYEGTGEGRGGRRQTIYIRTGSEKGTSQPHDNWSQERYGTTGQPTGQVLELWPATRRMTANLDFDTGVLAHEAYYLSELVKKEGLKEESGNTT